jgi:mono/diheme cytochrome c family protein
MLRKKLFIISTLAGMILIIAACSDVRREPGRVYMPDMAYSRAVESYSVTPEQKEAWLKKGIHYSNEPVKGTIKRGELFPFAIEKDKEGDSTNYVLSKLVHNPIPVLDAVQMKEAERLYLVNCGICHGPKIDGNGPLYRGGEGPYPVKPANLAGDAKYIAMPEGQMFYSVTYGKNKMGSYASQLDTRQRWMVIDYIKSKNQAASADSTKKASPAAKTADSTKASKK